MKHPNDCENLTDIRDAIDAIDKEIIARLGKRMGYVKAASKFKPTQESIPAPDRVGLMIPQRKKWAKENELDPDFIGPLFAQVIHWFISQQTKHWKNTR